MPRAAVLTRWEELSIESDGGGAPTTTLYRIPHLCALFAGRIEDTTHQLSANIPPAPNFVIVEIDASDAELDAIRAHGLYGQLSVLWVQGAQSQVVTEPQYDAFTQWLANRFGVSQPAVLNILGLTSNGRTRLQIERAIAAYLLARTHQ